MLSFEAHLKQLVLSIGSSFFLLLSKTGLKRVLRHKQFRSLSWKRNFQKHFFRLIAFASKRTNDQKAIDERNVRFSLNDSVRCKSRKTDADISAHQLSVAQLKQKSIKSTVTHPSNAIQCLLFARKIIIKETTDCIIIRDIISNSDRLLVCA